MIAVLNKSIEHKCSWIACGMIRAMRMNLATRIMKRKVLSVMTQTTQPPSTDN